MSQTLEFLQVFRSFYRKIQLLLNILNILMMMMNVTDEAERIEKNLNQSEASVFTAADWLKSPIIPCSV